MTNGRTVWWAKDAAWWRRERTVELLEEFGTGGPAVIDWLSCEAKAQNDGGFVKTGCRAIARGLCMEAVTVGHVLSRAVTLGLLDDYTEDRGVISCRVSGWKTDQERAQAAKRKADQRAREPINTGDEGTDVTAGHSESRPVTESPPTGQDRTELTTPTGVVTTDEHREDVERLCLLLSELTRKRADVPKVSPRYRVNNRGRRAMRLLLDKDGRSAEEVERAIRWVDSHDFWSGVILSPDKLRAHYDEIRLQARRQRNGTDPAKAERDERRLAAVGRLVAEGNAA